MKVSDKDPKIMSLDVIQKQYHIQRVMDVTDTAREIGLVSDLTIYVSDFVWQHYIVWNNEDNKFFGAQESQQKRLENILTDVVRLITISKEEYQPLYFNRSIKVRSFEFVAVPETILFKLNYAYDQNGEICLVVHSQKL